jgi:hypothetical protein
MFPLKVILDQDGYHIINNGIGEVVGDYYSLQERYKKIILTTDQDLIKDGVQAIDDEFLEWFVKNPSCEEVEVKKQYVTPLGDIVDTCYDNERLNYKIIIPQEETKQETLEELKKRFANDKSNKDIDLDYQDGIYYGIELGAKWQQEQDEKMYSEEEHTDILEVGQILVNEETLEYGLLQYIKICLECNNESQAIRLLEKYGFEKQEERYSEEEVLEILNKFSASCYSPIEKFEIPGWFKKIKNK